MFIATLLEFAGRAYETIANTPHELLPDVVGQKIDSTTLLEASQSRAFGVPPVDTI